MNFTRKRGRDGPPHHPPAKRHDHKPEEKRDAPQTKAAPPAPPKSSTPQPPASNGERKPLPPAPPRSSTSEPEQLRFDVTSGEMVADASALFTQLDSIRTAATSMLDKAIGSETVEGETKEAIKELGRTGFVALSQLRTLHRQVHSEVDQRRQQSSSHQDADFLNVMQVLQSTKYERDAFKSLVEAQPSVEGVPGLISEEDYLREAKGLPKGPRDSDSEHDVLLKRLKFEEERRKAMRVKLKEIPAKQTSLKAGLATETRDLDTMKREIREIGRQVSKLQQSLKLEPLTLQQSDPRAAELPQPLYNMYVQVSSWVSVFGGDHVDVSVSGVVNAPPQNERSRHHNPRDKHKRDAHAASSSDGLLSKEQCQQLHPLSIILGISVPSAKNSAPQKVTFAFEYLVNMNIVTVTPLNNEDPRILVNLFPHDEGEFSPNPANQLQVAPGTDWMPRRARAYKWAQSLCGLHFHAEPTDVFLSSASTAETRATQTSSLTDTIETLKKRVKNHFDFNGITSELNSGKIETQNVIRPNAPDVGVMRRWATKGPKDAQRVLRDMEQYYETHRMTLPDGALFDANKAYFLAVFGTNSAQILEVCVSMAPEYPEIAPNFLIRGIHASASPSEIQLINDALSALQPVATVPGRPETLVNYTLSWLKGCISIIDDMQRRANESRFTKLEKRYALSTW